jgi:hypothetical protein
MAKSTERMILVTCTFPWPVQMTPARDGGVHMDIQFPDCFETSEGKMTLETDDFGRWHATFPEGVLQPKPEVIEKVKRELSEKPRARKNGSKHQAGNEMGIVNG